MPKIADFLKALVVKAGGNVDEAVIKAALGALPADLEMPDTLSTAIDNGLLSVTQAKNNHPEIRSHYTALALNGVDSELDRFIEAEKLPDDVIALLKAQGLSTAQRAITLAKQIKELEGKKTGASKVDKDEHQKKLAELNDELRRVKEEQQGLLAKHKDEIQAVRRDHSLGGLLVGYKTRFDDLDPITKQTVISNIINKNLASKKAKLTVDEAGNLTLIGEDGSNVFGDDHRPLTPKAFLDKVMADEKILVVNDGNGNTGANAQQSSGANAQQTGQQRQQYFQNNNANSNNGNRKPNLTLQSLAQESLNDLEKAGGNGGSFL
jgi:hypothetical protein